MKSQTSLRAPDFLARPRVRRLVAATPLHADGADAHQVLVFRRILEHAVAEGRWGGQMGLPS